MLKHIGALVGIAIVVFGAIYLLTSDLPFDQPSEDVSTAGEAAMPAPDNPAEEEVEPAEDAETGTTAEATADAEPAEDAEAEAPVDVAAEPATETEAEAPDNAEVEVEPAGEAEMEPMVEVEPAAEAEAEPSGSEAAGEMEGEPVESGAVASVDAETLAAGEEIFSQNCQACHGESGEGGVGPALAGNATLEDSDHVIQTIVFGTDVMPPFGDQLSDEEIASVASFIRNSWGNGFGPVTADEVTAAR